MRTIVFILWLGLTVCFSASVFAGGTIVDGVGGRFNVNTKSVHEKKWDTVMRQKYDISCGSAAVATLLTHHYEMPTDEDEVFKSMFAHGDQEKIQAEGFSMLDMKRFLDSKGLRSDGFKVDLDKITSIGQPAIALINTNGFRHFVVVKGVDGERVMVGDPALGTRIMTRDEFLDIWNGAVLAARERAIVARKHFNVEADWQVRPKSPISDVTGQGVGLGTFMLTLPGLNSYGID